MGYNDLSEFSELINNNELILLKGYSKDFNLMKYHYAFSDIEIFIDALKKDSNFIISFVDEDHVDLFEKEGYEVFGVFRDYWNTDITDVENTDDYCFLETGQYKEASELTFACKGQSRGFMGQTAEWIADWMSPDCEQSQNIGMTDNTILVHMVEGVLAGLICVGIYSHESEKGAVLWIRELAVHPKFQRRGIAKKLLKQGLNYGIEHEAKRAFLMADDLNKHAIALYKKMGFEPKEDECQIDMIKKGI